jgi:hypothetical protein
MDVKFRAFLDLGTSLLLSLTMNIEERALYTLNRILCKLGVTGHISGTVLFYM